MATTVTGAYDMGNDVLKVTGQVDGIEVEVEARGWVSALTNHYGPECYTMDETTGALMRVEGATPRAMTAEERLAYFCTLLEEQNRVAVPAPEPVSLL